MTHSKDADLADFVDYLRGHFRQASASYGLLVDVEARLKAAKETAEGREDDAADREGNHEEDGHDSATGRGG